MIEIAEYIGYAGSALVALSLMMKNILRLRVINLIGAITFVVYGYFINAWPVIVMNAFITLVDLYYIVDIFRKKQEIELFKATKESGLLSFFNIYWDDIKKFYPNLIVDDLSNCESYFVSRNLAPTGLFVFKRLENNEAEILMDYVTPDYRDFKNAEFLYSSGFSFLYDLNIKTLKTKANSKAQIEYLKKVGFKLADDGDNILVKEIDKT